MTGPAKRGGLPGTPSVRAVLVLVVLVALLAVRVLTTGVRIDSDLQSILPDDGADHAAIAALHRAGEAVAARIVIGIAGGDAALRSRAARDLEQRLTGTGQFMPVATDLQQTTAWVRAHRYELVCGAGDRPLDDVLDDAWARSVLRRARAMIYSGMVPLDAAGLTEDPFQLTVQHLSCLTDGLTGAGAGTGQSADMVIVAGRLLQSPYQMRTQAMVQAALDGWRADPGFASLRVLRSGAVFFAEAAAARARQEITLVGGASVLLILLLYGLAFRRPVAALLALLTAGAGAAGGLALCLIVYGGVHFSVLVFGSAMTGIAADYAVHSLAARRAMAADGKAGGSGHAGLVRALTVSMLTSVCGFAALFLFDIAVFRQIGVFAIGGLAAAWLFAVTVLPHLDRSGTSPGRRAVLFHRTGTMLHRFSIGRTQAITASVLVVLIGVLGFLRADPVDDIRRFQSLDADLRAEQAQLFPGGRGQVSGQFLLSVGDDLDEALRNETSAARLLADSGISVAGSSRLQPWATRRAEVRAAYERQLIGPYGPVLAAELGLATAPRIAANRDATAQLPDWMQALRFEQDGRHYLLAPITGVGKSVANGPGVDPATARLIDPASTYGTVLATYRELGLQVAALAALLSALALAGIYRRLAAAIIVLPPVAGCIVALALPALLGVPVTLFSVFALFIVLGTGIDFAVFQWEMAGDKTGWTGVAVQIAAFSTCLAMGMLGFSDTLPVMTFGLTISVGVMISMVLSFLIKERRVSATSTHG